jgi:hypothetical protein
MFVAQHRLAWFDPQETVRGQHTMATAAWHLIYHAEVEGASPDPQAVAYMRKYRADPRSHFCTSHARKALSAEQVGQQRALKSNRDGGFYKD